ncbi:MAG: CocE/NonD family hydrolase [Chloroflexi bacterium]|nr:CocE/NonD family hydrolase [Chloroflexota bacterium]
MPIRVDQNVPARMRDGTTLYADVYRPEAPGRYPVILTRTPYDKDNYGTRVDSLDPIRAAREGYAVVIQNVRGRYNSEGEFYTFMNEIEDGYDTVEWAAAQPWSTGKVGMHGGSYVGATQWLAAVSRPPHLAAIFPSITSHDYYEGWTYQGGAFQLNFALNWSLSLSLANMENLSRSLGDLAAEGKVMAEAFDHLHDAVGFLPLKDYPALSAPGLAPYYYDWIKHPENDSYWHRWNIEDRHHTIQVPAYSMGGWYDIFLGGTIRNFVGMRKNGATEEARRGQKLMIGPWFHDSDPGNKTGEVDFGLASDTASFDFHGIKLRWFDHWLKAEENGIIDEAPVRIFVMGANVWRDEGEWPLSRTRYVNYYLHSDGNANTLNGDGSLSPEAPGDERWDVFLYNPVNPVPTRGGGLCCHEAAYPPGALDQREVESRADVLVYSTPPLEKDTEVTGPVAVTLWAASSAVDTDFTAKLVDLCPCGGAINLTDGIIRARYRESTTQARLIQPDEVYEYKIDLWATSNVFKAGHSIRLEISSSNFPRFDRNPNTGNALGEDTALRPASQMVLHNSRYPSCVTLPVIPS